MNYLHSADMDPNQDSCEWNAEANEEGKTTLDVAKGLFRENVLPDIQDPYQTNDGLINFHNAPDRGRFPNDRDAFVELMFGKSLRNCKTNTFDCQPDNDLRNVQYIKPASEVYLS